MKLFRTRRLQRCASLIAILAMVLAALAPAVSQALVANGKMDSGWIEVCTAEGMRWVEFGVEFGADSAPGSPAEHPAQQSAGLCAYCCIHAASFGLAPGPFSSFSLADAALAHGPARAHDPAPDSRIWSPQQSRAPPWSS